MGVFSRRNKNSEASLFIFRTRQATHSIANDITKMAEVKYRKKLYHA